MKCRWCGVTDETNPYWKNRWCCDNEKCREDDLDIGKIINIITEDAHLE